MKKPLVSPGVISRRSFIKGLTYGAGAAIGTRLVGSGRGWEGEAKADNEKPALFCVYLRGGYNALFSAPSGMKGSFGIDDGNIEAIANDLFIDAPTYGTLDPKKVATLTPRERDILSALASGQHVKDIAQDLDISTHTARNHMKAILRKLDVHSQIELLAKLVGREV